jgi:tetratricopeptide (TPR) repeat protein
MRLLQISLFLAAAASMAAQIPGLTLPPSGNNQKASVAQYIGPVQITIDYSSPAVHGPDGKDRRGQIWGKLVPYGTANLGFGNGKPSPWRAGANENTVFTASNDVMIEGKRLQAGRYGLHMIPGAEEWTLIFSKNADSWGSFFYEENEDALRVQVKPHKHDYREWLAYEFPVRKPSEAVAELQWEDLAVPFTVKVDSVDDIYMTRIRHELTSVPGFSYQGYVAAVQYCLQTGKNLDQALVWADAAIKQPFIGQANFNTLTTKAMVLRKLGRDDEAKKVVDAALRLPGTTPLEIHQYGRQLLNDKKNQEAMEVFKLNAERNGDTWPTHVGLARGYAALGDKPQALEHAKKALAQAPDDLNRNSLADMVKSLSSN